MTTRSLESVTCEISLQTGLPRHMQDSQFADPQRVHCYDSRDCYLKRIDEHGASYCLYLSLAGKKEVTCPKTSENPVL